MKCRWLNWVCSAELSRQLIYRKLLREVLPSLKEQWAVSGGYIWSDIEWMWMMTADERVQSHLAVVLPVLRLAQMSPYLLQVTSSTTRTKTKGPATEWEEMLTSGTQMAIIAGLVTIMLICSMSRIKIWHQNPFRSVVPTLCPQAGVSIFPRESESEFLSSPASDSVGFPSWKIFLCPCDPLRTCWYPDQVSGRCRGLISGKIIVCFQQNQ